MGILYLIPNSGHKTDKAIHPIEHTPGITVRCRIGGKGPEREPRPPTQRVQYVQPVVSAITSLLRLNTPHVLGPHIDHIIHLTEKLP